MTRWYVPQHFKAIVGGNTYIDTPDIIRYKGQSVFELRRSESDAFLAINFAVFAPNKQRLVTVRNGQFVGDVPDGYELTQTHDHFTLAEKRSGRVVCELRLRDKASEDAEIEVSASMYMPDGSLIELSPTGTNIGGIQMSGNTFVSCGAAIDVK